MSALIVVCLFLHYAAAMGIFGAAAFRLLLPADAARGIDGRLRAILVGVVALVLVSAVAVLMAAASSMGGEWRAALDPQTVGEVLTDTAFGRVWQWHLALLVLTGIAALRTPLQAPWAALAAALALASLAFTGHAAAVEGFAGVLRRLNQGVHLLAAGAWFGGLVPLALALANRRQAAGQPIHILDRFSRLGMAAVGLVLVTGIINSLALVASLHGLVATPYGWTLLAKIGLVAVMIALAAANRFILMPRLPTRTETVLPQLRRMIVLEIGLGLAVILAASLLGTLAPAH